MDVVTQKAYGYRRGDNYVYVNREARMGRTALVIHPALKERSNMLAEPASDIKTCDYYEQFPLDFSRGCATTLWYSAWI